MLGTEGELSHLGYRVTSDRDDTGPNDPSDTGRKSAGASQAGGGGEGKRQPGEGTRGLQETRWPRPFDTFASPWPLKQRCLTEVRAQSEMTPAEVTERDRRSVLGREGRGLPASPPQAPCRHGDPACRPPPPGPPLPHFPRPALQLGPRSVVPGFRALVLV